MAERPAEARLQQDQRLERSYTLSWDSPGKPLQLADNFPKQTCDTGPALNTFNNQQFLSLGRCFTITGLRGKEEELVKELTWAIRYDSL